MQVATSRVFVAAVLLATYVPANAGLDRVDADGVTETGGTAAYARLLTRTGPDGRLDASLLPPAADWVSRPVTNAYCVCANAPAGGNGSVQYPFNSLSSALSAAAPNSVIVLAPGVYTGAGSIPSASELTIFGFGGAASVSSLTLSVGGNSPLTTVRLAGLSIDRLLLNGGRTRLLLSGSTVSQLGGTATPVTTVLGDLGSSVGSVVLAHAATYTERFWGRPYAPMAHGALAVTNTVDGTSLTVAGGRASVGSAPVAFLSDVSAHSNAVDAAISTLSASNSVLVSALGVEASARISGDTSVSNHFASEIIRVTNAMGGIGDTWYEQLSTLTTRIGTSDSAVSALRTKESNDVIRLEAAIEGAKSFATSADSAQTSLLRSEISTAKSSLRSEVSTLIDTRSDTRSDARIVAATPTIVSNAVRQAKNYTDVKLSTRDNRLTSVESGISTANSRLNALKTAVNDLIDHISVLTNHAPSKVVW